MRHFKNAVVIEEVKPILNDDLDIFSDNDVFERDFLQKAIKEVIPSFEI